LSYLERKSFILEIADTIGNWNFARLIAECIDKVYFNPKRYTKNLEEQSFEQILSRFEQFLKITEVSHKSQTNYGMLIYDNNETVAKRFRELMKNFQKDGTSWTSIKNIIETPLFVNSELTAMIQVADVCAYSLRRYLENDESELFEKIYKRADRKDNLVVGVRHFSENSCQCEICNSRKR
jgi:hypothetical protein